MKGEISIFSRIISLPDFLIFEDTEQPDDDFMNWSGLGNTFEPIDEFCKDLNMIILHFD